MGYSPEAQLIRDAQLSHGYNVGDRFGLLEIAAEVVREQVREAKEECYQAAWEAMHHGTVNCAVLDAIRATQRPMHQSTEK